MQITEPRSHTELQIASSEQGVDERELSWHFRRKKWKYQGVRWGKERSMAVGEYEKDKRETEAEGCLESRIQENK